MYRYDLDILKSLAFIFLAIAHTNPPPILFQFRNFDVVLLVLISAFLHAPKTIDFFDASFIKNRFLRILVPVWIFMLLVFVVFTAAGTMVNIQFPMTSVQFIKSLFLLPGGIPYFWILRVFLMVALLTPMIFLCYRRSKSSEIWLLSCIIILCISSYLSLFLKDAIWWKEYIGLAIPYASIFSIGLCLHSAPKRTEYALIAISLSVYLLYGFTLGSWETQPYKYPPQLPYISYGIGMSLIAKHIVEHYVKRIPLFFLKAARWISVNSLWLYLYHIIVIRAYDVLFDNYSNVFIAKFSFVILGTGLIMFVHSLGSRKIVEPIIPSLKKYM